MVVGSENWFLSVIMLVLIGIRWIGWLYDSLDGESDVYNSIYRCERNAVLR